MQLLAIRLRCSTMVEYKLRVNNHKVNSYSLVDVVSTDVTI